MKQKNEWRELYQVATDYWEKLPNNVFGHPVYFRWRDGLIEIWPKNAATDHLKFAWRYRD